MRPPCIVTSVFIALALFLLCPPSQATVHVPADFPTIQEAIDAAASHDTILVAPGTYVENLDTLGKDLTLRSEAGPAVTVIDGEARPFGAGFDIGADENLDCWDFDHDLRPDEACGGDDCDDTNPEASPDHTEIPGNGVDDDCDGRIDETCFVEAAL